MTTQGFCSSKDATSINDVSAIPPTTLNNMYNGKLTRLAFRHCPSFAQVPQCNVQQMSSASQGLEVLVEHSH
jgi:hypothetical protein